jgi:hypothetical protein
MAITQEKNVKSVAFQTSEAADLQPPFQLGHNLGLPAPDPGKLSSA